MGQSFDNAADGLVKNVFRVIIMFVQGAAGAFHFVEPHRWRGVRGVGRFGLTDSVRGVGFSLGDSWRHTMVEAVGRTQVTD